MDDGPGRCLSGVMEGAMVAVGTMVAAAVVVGVGVVGAQEARNSTIIAGQMKSLGLRELFIENL